ncbi:MAG: biopolymer transporter ExbD [Candidatus Tectomicrobia bacterium]|nr:biopolymer transporter ExbD [Candidatus Tectomicrobia bacterium]
MLSVSDEQAQRSEASGPSLMALLDVMLLLLIFFLLASVFVQPTLEVDLPDAENSEAEPPETGLLTISVSSDGDVFINKQFVPIEELQGRIEVAVAEDPDVPVMVRADEQSAFRYFVSVMDAVKGAGVVQLTIETEPGPGGGNP